MPFMPSLGAFENEEILINCLYKLSVEAVCQSTGFARMYGLPAQDNQL